MPDNCESEHSGKLKVLKHLLNDMQIHCPRDKIVLVSNHTKVSIHQDYYSANKVYGEFFNFHSHMSVSSIEVHVYYNTQIFHLLMTKMMVFFL